MSVVRDQEIEFALELNNVGQWYGENRVLHDIDFKVQRGQFVGLVGPSGCGKTTLLRAILGTDNPKAGEVVVNNEVVRGPNRHVGVVHQDYNETIYDFLTAEENVALGLKLDQTGILDRFLVWEWWPKRKQHLEMARELLTKIGLGRIMKLYPKQMSGGQCQRVAIAQSIIMRPKVLLLDEPFSALDESTREQLQKMLLLLYQENAESISKGEAPPHTVVFITHAQNEAFYCADRVVGLSRNWTQDIGVENAPPDGIIHGEVHGATKIYDKPAPVYHPDDPKNFDLFEDQKRELHHAVFNPDNPNQNRFEHVLYKDGELAVGKHVETT